MKQAARWSRSLLLAVALGSPSAHAQGGRGDVVYVPTPQVVVDEMLRMAKVGANDFLIDLGSGDGRIVITAAKKLGARGFGVDLDTYLLGVANAAAQKEGVADRAKFMEQNLFETDLRPANVITSYLLPEINLKLRPKLLALRPGTRVVTHDYHMGDWESDVAKTLLVPEKTVGDAGKSYLYLYIVPARMAGHWECEIAAGGAPVSYAFNFEQNYQMVHGTARAFGQDLTLPQIRLSGDRIEFDLKVPAASGPLVHHFSGLVRGSAIEGTVTIGEGAGRRVVPWKAKQIAQSR